VLCLIPDMKQHKCHIVHGHYGFTYITMVIYIYIYIYIYELFVYEHFNVLIHRKSILEMYARCTQVFSFILVSICKRALSKKHVNWAIKQMLVMLIYLYSILVNKNDVKLSFGGCDLLMNLEISTWVALTCINCLPYFDLVIN